MGYTHKSPNYYYLLTASISFVYGTTIEDHQQKSLIVSPELTLMEFTLIFIISSPHFSTIYYSSFTKSSRSKSLREVVTQ